MGSAILTMALVLGCDGGGYGYAPSYGYAPAYRPAYSYYQPAYRPVQQPAATFNTPPTFSQPTFNQPSFSQSNFSQPTFSQPQPTFRPQQNFGQPQNFGGGGGGRPTISSPGGATGAQQIRVDRLPNGQFQRTTVNGNGRVISRTISNRP